MGKVRVRGFAVSVDGFGAGPDQSLENPLGVRGPEMFQWFFPTRTFQAMHGGEGGSRDVDDEFGPGHEAGVVTDKERHGGGEFLRVRSAAQRGLRNHSAVGFRS